MRQRIVALLQDYSEGLTSAEIARVLGAKKGLADTCLGMRRDGLLQRVGHGQYVVAEPSSSNPTGRTKRPPAQSWWVQKLSADLTAD
jgi:hypothetical protein